MSPDLPAWDQQQALLAARQRVQDLLLQQTEIGLDPQGRVFVTSDSTRIFLEFVPQMDTQVVYLNLTCPVAGGVPITGELLEYLARAADLWYFGHLTMVVEADEHGQAGTASIAFTHTLIADEIGAAQLAIPVFAMLDTVAGLRSDFIGRFGGSSV